MFQKYLKQALVLTLFFSFSCLHAIEKNTTNQDDNKQIQAKIQDSTEVKLKELEKLINDINTKINKKEKENELKKLLEQANQLTTVEKKEDAGLGKKFHTGVRQQSALNPNISVGGDFFSSISSSKSDFVNKSSNLSYGNNGFYLRELQLALVSPLDPFTRGKTFISFTRDAIYIEEAYMEWLNLPLKMNLKVGIFKPEFGALNRWHDHALHQFDRPKALVNIFSNVGLGGAGFTGNFLLPRLLWADASSFDAAIIRGGNDQSFTSQGKYNLQYVGHLKNYYDLNQSTYFEFTLSGVAGNNDPQEKYKTYVGDLGFSIRWVPAGRSKYRTIDWRTEFLYSKWEMPDRDVYSKGFYTSLQNKLNSRWWLSGRFDYSELPYDNDQSEWALTGCIDFWQSEFVYFRLQYQYSNRDFTNVINLAGPYPDDSTFTFHVCWAMGPDKHEKY